MPLQPGLGEGDTDVPRPQAVHLQPVPRPGGRWGRAGPPAAVHEEGMGGGGGDPHLQYSEDDIQSLTDHC